MYDVNIGAVRWESITLDWREWLEALMPDSNRHYCPEEIMTIFGGEEGLIPNSIDKSVTDFQWKMESGRPIMSPKTRPALRRGRLTVVICEGGFSSAGSYNDHMILIHGKKTVMWDITKAS